MYVWLTASSSIRRGASGRVITARPALTQLTSERPRTVPPHLVPFSFDSDLRVGDLVTATCVVRSGDSPLTLLWLRDGRPLPPADDLVTRDTGDRISVLLIPHVRAAHVGRYTCQASNAAGTARLSATLVARGTATPACAASQYRGPRLRRLALCRFEGAARVQAVLLMCRANLITDDPSSLH